MLMVYNDAVCESYLYCLCCLSMLFTVAIYAVYESDLLCIFVVIYDFNRISR